MPVEDGKIYVVTGTPPTGVSFADVQSVLGTNKYYENELCTHPNINMWSKYKPVRRNIIDTTGQLETDGNRIVWKANSTWWQGEDGKYGLDLSGAEQGLSIGRTGMETALANLAAKIDGGMNGWAYNKPRGGDSEPYRIWDFNQYWHKAPNPVNLISMTDVTASLNSKYVVAVDPQDPDTMSPIESRFYVTPLDIKSMHLGFAIFKGSAPIAWVTDTATWEGTGINNSDAADGIISRGDTEVTAMLRDKGTYKILPFYSTESLPQPSTANSSKQPTSSLTKLYTVPNTDFVTFSAYQAATSEIIADGYPSSHKANRRNEYSATFYLDSTGTYYQGSATSFVVEVLVARISWNEYKDMGKPSPSQNAAVAFYMSKTYASMADDTKVTIGSCSNVALDFEGGWCCYVVVTDEAIPHNILSYGGNLAPT